MWLVHKRKFLPAIPLVFLLLAMAWRLTTAGQADTPPPAPVAAAADLAAAPHEDDLRLVIVAHGQTSRFWKIVVAGVEQASTDMHVQVEYLSPDPFDIQAMRQMLDDAIASAPDGLIITIPDAAVLTPSIEAAQAAGIPIISFNSGGQTSQQLGLLTHIGQLEYEAGRAAGLRMAEAGLRQVLFLNHNPENATITDRYQGAADALALVNGTVEMIAINRDDLEASRRLIREALEANPEIDSILSANTVAATVVLELQQDYPIQYATFDLSPDVLKAIQAGQILFAVDQQPYMQGYMSVLLMSLYLRNNNSPGKNWIATGPSFITAANIEQVLALSEAGTR